MSGCWKRLRIPLSFTCTVSALLTLPISSSGSNPQEPKKFTWQILSQTGEVVWGISKEAPLDTWWPDLVFDLCLLIAGLDSWDIPEYVSNNLPVLAEETHLQRTASLGCARPLSGCQLRLTAFYICPSDGRSKQEARCCGGLESFYCRDWECETTGTTYWSPSSSWNLISLSRNYTRDTRSPQRGRYVASSRATCNKGPCNPLVLKFTDKGRSYPKWVRGQTWGLRFYESGMDLGIVFSVHLKVEGLPSTLVGPNKVLPEQGLPAPVPPPKVEPSLKTNPTPTSSPSLLPTSHVTAFNPPSTGQRLLDLVQGAFLALNRISPNVTESCWLCLAASPPYYEGTATLGSFKITTSHESCH